MPSGMPSKLAEHVASAFCSKTRGTGLTVDMSPNTDVQVGALTIGGVLPVLSFDRRTRLSEALLFHTGKELQHRVGHWTFWHHVLVALIKRIVVLRPTLLDVFYVLTLRPNEGSLLIVVLLETCLPVRLLRPCSALC